METPLKQRLVGLSVLVALAAIFLPMILDGSGREGHVRIDMEIPPEPVFPAPERLPPLPDEVEPAAATAAAASADDASEQDEAPGRPPRREAVLKPVPDERKAADVAAPQSAPAVAEGWAVQVGSFSQQARARSLRDELKSDGFAAFIEPFTAGEGTVYRVKVGPEDSRSAAEELAARLESAKGLKVLVVSQQ